MALGKYTLKRNFILRTVIVPYLRRKIKVKYKLAFLIVCYCKMSVGHYNCFFSYCIYSYWSQHLSYVFRCTSEQTSSVPCQKKRQLCSCTESKKSLLLSIDHTDKRKITARTYILMYISVVLRLSLAVFILKNILNEQIPSNNYLFAIVTQLFKVKTNNWAFQLWFQIQSLFLLSSIYLKYFCNEKELGRILGFCYFCSSCSLNPWTYVYEFREISVRPRINNYSTTIV